MELSLEMLLREFDVKTEQELFKKRTSHDKVIKAMATVDIPRRVTLTVPECQKLCDKNGLRYHPGYENRVIERVTTTEAPDRYGDIVRAKGIDNANYRKNAVVLYAHNHGDFPVGKSLKEWIDKAINGWRSWDLYFGDEVDPTGKSDLTFRMVDSGAMPGGSIGFIPGEVKGDHSPEERTAIGLGRYGVEYITCEKLEHSACSVPANPEALSNCLKSIDQKRFKALFSLVEIDRMEAQKMLDGQLLDIFASVLGVQKTYSIPPAPPADTSVAISKDVVLKPYPNEHAARVRDPGDFIEDSFRRKNIITGVDIIVGKLTGGDGSMVTQTYRFSTEEFTAAQAKKWLKDNNVEYMSFEAATGKALEIPPVQQTSVINLAMNIDISKVQEAFSVLLDQAKAINGTLDATLKSFETRSSQLLTATERALTALEQKTKTMGLYDRKEIEGILRIGK